MKKPLIILIVLSILVSACGVKRFIPENEKLYTGATFKINSEHKIEALKDIEKELELLLRPQPNISVLGAKLGLLAYYKVEKGKPGFIYRFIHKKTKEDPVYLSSVNINRTKELIKNRLDNLGFFNSEVISQVTNQKYKSEVTYSIKLYTPYRLETYKVYNDSLPIFKAIKEIIETSILKKGDPFNLAKLTLERERIDFYLKSKGYYNFNPDFLIFEADTNQYKTKRFDLFLRLKKEVPKKAIIPYEINKVNVFPNYGLQNKNQRDTVAIENINFIQDSLFFKPNRLKPYFLFAEGQKYDPKKFKSTSRRLSSIGIYKFVNVKFEENQSVKEMDSIGKLNANVYLSPLNKQSLSTELQINTKSSSFTGPALALAYTNRNLFKGGETIKITGKFGFETQAISNINNGLSSTQLGLMGDLIFPRLLFPIKLSQQFDYAIPKTKISLGLEYLNRSKLYSLSSFNNSFGYGWQANSFVYHEFDPISTSFIKLSNSTDAFNVILDENPFLKNSFNQELISGLTYSFTYNELNSPSKRHPIFIRSNLELVGNTLSLFKGNRNEDGKNTILGLEYAQYVKVDTDVRYKFDLGDENLLVTRLYGGIGVPYGNSDILPFSKQFFSGGAYSIRAFSTRSIGPGTYIANNTDTAAFFDSSGDVKLEANIEYRFPLFSYLKGAFFFDAGNVWLLNENETIVGGQFSSNFINELAMGTGFGIRLDIQSFVIRLDWAAPVHKPIPESKVFEFDRKNAILNFAIGYPF
ncbi:hypothetical protein A8C32_04970 [Flavivirga aquatica]|uniref:Bacterial surface antigen (D15) domain-containing protein n=1 Tax=Flavivirga aquatica TaxID=1849968 RepID=A0A1E5SHH0_9FLAO|nr:BamA/TamA family outer membrane protein [Flavivirga aquatica]OEJ98558.1 hypothetical protein A8C32_04970 [Flavivirga aquatica]